MTVLISLNYLSDSRNEDHAFSERAHNFSMVWQQRMTEMEPKHCFHTFSNNTKGFNLEGKR